MLRRSWFAASLSILAGLGCHASPPAKVERSEPPITLSDVTATRFIAKHNKNAAAIRSLEASPSVAFIGENGDRKSRHRANGHLALQRDKDFRLELEVMKHDIADIGSNEQGFWFWVDDDQAKALYVCDHKDINSCQLAVTLQPEWIMEAMGLREFTEDEAAKINAKQGTTPGTLVLTQFRKDAKGQTYTKETIINEAKGTILEHRLYSGAKKELLASAVVTNYVESKLYESPSPDPRARVDEQVATIVTIPEKFRLTWIKEKFSLDIVIAGLKVNPTFPEERAVALFSEPKIPGTTKKNLALLDNPSPAGARMYESRPMPQPGGINLGTPQPSPVGLEGETRRAIDPIPLTADLSSTPAQPAGIAGSAPPTVSDLNTVRTSTLGRWRKP